VSDSESGSAVASKMTAAIKIFYYQVLGAAADY
jgi:hypothetical protein